MGKLEKLAATSDLMKIDITYAGKRHRFDLSEELLITEATINKEIKKHASSYSFLCMLRTHLLREVKRLEAERKRTKRKVYTHYKDSKGTSGRAPSDDFCWAKAETSKKYKEVVEFLIQAEFNWGIIDNAVKSFEIRKDLIQSLSANLRNER